METPKVGARFGIHKVGKKAISIIFCNPLFFKSLHRSLDSHKARLAA